MHDAIARLMAGNDLTRSEAEGVMESILAGRAGDAQIGAFITALRMKGETVEELVGFATAMRRHCTPVFAAGRSTNCRPLVDTCGTGGDARGTFNVSTCAAFVVAGAGVHVAKHGNRSVSSRCGSADVLEALGVNLNSPPERVGEAIEKVGIGFLFAPALHGAMKHAARARSELKMRTVFNLLGPLTNPAGASAQVLGVFDATFAEMLASALARLGCERAFVVHGADGLDEISLSGETTVAELREGMVACYTVEPEDFGLPRAPIEAIAGGDAAANAAIIRRVLRGEIGPPRDIVLANASAALVAAGRAAEFLEGVRLAAQSIDSGAALRKLESLVEFTTLYTRPA
jgi:anthranilate phosphoribosyltransferase